MLILVDGKSTVSALHEKAVSLTDLETTLEHLALLGFIQANDADWQKGVETSGNSELERTSTRPGRGPRVREVSMAKAYCAELLNEVVYDCLQFHGGAGYLRETAIERMYRDMRVQERSAAGRFDAGFVPETVMRAVARRPHNCRYGK